jgi:hypothetical protein
MGQRKTGAGNTQGVAMEIDAQGEIVRNISLPIHQAKGWMKLVGVLSILYGVMMVFTIVGIIFAWLPIWMGVLLMQSASSVERAYATGDEAQLVVSLSKIKTYFTITGVLALLGLIMFAIVFLFGLTAATMLGGRSEYGGF